MGGYRLHNQVSTSWITKKTARIQRKAWVLCMINISILSLRMSREIAVIIVLCQLLLPLKAGAQAGGEREFNYIRFGLVSGLKLRYFCAVDVFGKAIADSYYNSLSSKLLNMSEDEKKDNVTTEWGYYLYELNKEYLQETKCEGNQLGGEEDLKKYLERKGVIISQ